ncbi:MAG TPA: ATP-dependent helicase [Candidatus Dormibacteraeota bacterium]|nr:ATP-dependent helicase [Candidatus Dormibacteraeota bacterium]
MSVPSDTYILRRPVREPRFRIDYQGLLNPAQLAAATTTEGPVLVIAGAGSGKTRTLVFRVARLVEQGVDPHAILLLTFTRKASAEMLRRAAGLLDGRCEQVAGGTFHSFANLTLRRHGTALGLASSFTILDRGDSEDAIGLLRARLGLDKKDKRFPRKQVIGELFSAVVNKHRPLDQLLAETYPHFAEHADDLHALHAAYAAYKSERSVLDYDDLLVKLQRLLAEHADVRERLAQRYAYVMVDEYQDTNPLQAQIVQLLGASHGNVMAVGDDAQSIYAFRGADFRNIMQFPDLFPGTRVITLEQNYRSTQPILEVANAVMSEARERYTKVLFTTEPEGSTPLLIAAEHENYQSRFVVQRILELREEGVPLSEIAVLFRSSFHSFDLELELSRADLPFIKRGGFKFIETAHVKDALAHLRVLENPRDAVSWHRLLLLLEGVGPKSADEIASRLLGAADIPAALETAGGRAQTTELRALAGLFRRLGEPGRRPDEQLAEVLRYYDPLLKRAHPDDYPKRQRDLEHFVSIAARYKTLESLLTDMALEPPSDSVGDVLATDDEEGLLCLSTIHSAKGLEWHTVFVIWLVDGKFPSTYSMHSDDELEEERRLLYVAVTRAKRNLYLSYPINMYDRATGMVLAKPSRFLDGVSRQLLKPMQLVESFD